MVKEHLSPVRKMMNSVAKDRIITKFPQAFHPDATPNEQINFSSNVREASQQNKTGSVGLKICKAVLVGDVAVGKSCLVNRFCHDVFDNDYKATIGVDFEVEKFSVLSVPFNLQIWDTAGQERFKCIAASYYRGANVVIVAFDLSEIGSLTSVMRWKEDACKSSTDPLVFLVGLKKDIVCDSAYHEVESQAILMANDMGAEYWAVSSKSGDNVQDFFFRVVSLTYDRAVQKELECISSPSKQQIGNNLIKVDDTNEPDYYDKSRKGPLKCC